jgi:hypothetical protein
MKEKTKKSTVSSRQHSRTKAGSKQAKSAADVWKEEMDRAEDIPAKAYTLDGHYEEGEKVDHRSFGLGMVKRLISPDKMEVLFEEETKVMIRGVNVPIPPPPQTIRQPRRLSWTRRQIMRPAKAVSQES